MRISLVFPDNDSRVNDLAGIMNKVWQDGGAEVSLLKSMHGSDNHRAAFNCFKRSDLIVLGSSTLGWSGGISRELEDIIRRQNLVEGRRVAVFIAGGFLGSSRALTRIMGLVEECGGFLFDFEIIKNSHNAEAFARRLLKLNQADAGIIPS